MKNLIDLTVLTHSSCIGAELGFMSTNFTKHLVLIPPSVAKLLNNILSLSILSCALTCSYTLDLTSLFIMTQCYRRRLMNESRSERVKERTRSEQQPARPLCWPPSGLETRCSASQFQ